MNDKISKTNVDVAFFNSRLDEVRMSGHERIKAKAQLERAEAMAEMLSAACSGIARAFKFLTARTPRQTAPSAG
jgi:hypothetical protein